MLRRRASLLAAGAAALAAVALPLLVGACGPLGPGEGADAGHADGEREPYAVEVVRFEAGEMAGFGAEALPFVVLGPPKGQGLENGSRDVLSLGLGGIIELRMGRDIVDGPGPDLLVFENPFECSEGLTFAEPGEVSVSEDGERWSTFPCSPPPDSGGCVSVQVAPHGCAGFEPVFANEERGLSATQPLAAGGDGFDLAVLGIERARFVRIVDKGNPGGLQAAPTAGFDLDAVAIVH